ncbi:translation initiation factor IF-6 [Candidatus Woesearchaeota archaeon]|nr:translation initiation factor IF-6 [Candidatus Woesearchaeota archaeon]
MHLLTTPIQNIGLYGFATDSYCLLGRDVPEEAAKDIEKVLKVPVHYITICGTSLVGVFCAGNNHCMLVPSIAFTEELKKLDQLKIPYKIIETRLTALGNNILTSDYAALVNPEFSADTKKRIRQALNVALRPGTVAGLGNVGSLGAIRGKQGIIHPETADEEVAYLGEFMDVSFTEATINNTSCFLRSGLICNKYGLVISTASSGQEINEIDMALGFLDS